MEQSTAIKRTKVHFPGISAKSWEHPADRAALTALRKVPGLDVLLQKLLGATTERSLRLLTLASAVRVTDTQFAKVNKLYHEACGILDVTDRPELFVSQSPFLNAGAIGVQKPFIVLNSSLVDSVKEEELLSVIAHELGHCMSGHVLYKTLLAILLRLSVYAMSIPLGGVPLLAIILALKEWDRKSELSADRAGLLVVQDPEVSYSVLMKLAGGVHTDQMDINEFFLQAAEYGKSESMLDSVHKLLNLVGQSHPFPVLRLTELKMWVDSGAYGKIVAGEYLNRADDGSDSARDTLRAAAGQYKEEFDKSEDPLAEFLRNAATNAGTAKEKAKDFFDGFFNNGPKSGQA
jgi:Zn-dependent protease with chaperone function